MCNTAPKKLLGLTLGASRRRSALPTSDGLTAGCCPHSRPHFDSRLVILTGGAALGPPQLRPLPEERITLALLVPSSLMRTDLMEKGRRLHSRSLVPVFADSLRLVHFSASVGGPLSRSLFKPLSLTSDSF